MQTYKILGLFLTYPTEELQAAMPECRNLLMQENYLPARIMNGLMDLTYHFETKDLLDLQEEYVALFDRTPSLSLHLFEHIHGDSRDRGQALADLLKVYEDAGLFIQNEEMPDFLPLFCEYVSMLPPAEASETLSSVVNILSILAERLTHRLSPYAAVCQALVDIAAQPPSAMVVKKALEMSHGSELTRDEIDATWQEQFAFENNLQDANQNSGCPKAEEMLARMYSGLSSAQPQKGAA